MGAFAEKVALEESDVAALGDAINFEQGAALGIPYLTAYRAIVQLGLAKPGETVLVHGASGGVGIGATQLARHLGLTVIGTAGSKEGLELVKSAGRADFAFNHNDPTYVDQIKANIKSPINLIVENLANINLHKDIDLIAQRGRIIVVGSRGEVSWNPATLFFKEVSLHGLLLATAPPEDMAAAMKNISSATKESGWVCPVVAKRYLLSEGPDSGNEALRDVIAQTDGARGKLVIVP